MSVARFDSAPVRLEKDARGFLRGEANVTRTGVFAYRLPSGATRRELRLPEEVFRADSLRSLALAPITLRHPGAVTSANAKAVTVGTIGEKVESADGKFVRASLILHADEAIKAVEGGTRELSCGYRCDLEMSSGVHDGERYDAIQRNIAYNHVAIEPHGRAGPEVALHLDADDAVRVDDDHNPGALRVDTKEETMTVKIRLDGIDYDVNEQTAQAFKVILDKKVAEVAAEKARADAAVIEAEKAKGRADAAIADAEKAREAASPAAVEKKIADRVSLVQSASKVLGSEWKADGKTDDEIKRAVIAKATPAAVLEGKGPEYIAARFDAALELSSATETKQDAAAKSVANVRTALTNADAAPRTVKQAREEMIARSRKMFDTAGKVA